MNYLDRHLSPAMVSALNGISVDTIRDWRRRDFLTRIGEQDEAGRWKYSFHEVIEMSLVRILEPMSKPIPELFYMARHSVFSVLDYLRGEDQYMGFKSRYNFFEFMSGDLRVFGINDLEKLTELRKPMGILIDNKELAFLLPSPVQEIILENGTGGVLVEYGNPVADVRQIEK